MTDNIPGDPVESIKRKKQKLLANIKFLWIGLFCILVGGGSAVATSFFINQQNTTLKTDNQSLEQQNTNIKLSVDQLNDLLGSACDSTKASSELKKFGICDAIQSIKNDPTNPVSIPGVPGVSITRTEQNQTGHLIVFFSDGTTQDAGLVKGADGFVGASGRSITTTTILNGELIIAYSDGTAQNLGSIVGPMGPIGPAGPPGKDSTIPGPPGEKGESTPQTINAVWSCNADDFVVLTLNSVDYPSPIRCTNLPSTPNNK